MRTMEASVATPSEGPNPRQIVSADGPGEGDALGDIVSHHSEILSGEFEDLARTLERCVLLLSFHGRI
jgi:hypothetical protein